MDGTSRAEAEVRGSASALVTFLTTMLLGVIALLVALWLRPDWFGRLVRAVPTPAPPTAVDVFEAVAPSVVHVTTRVVNVRGIYGEVVVSGTGSGLVWDDLGHVVTCDHIFDDGVQAATVALSNGMQFAARLVGRDEDSDIAVIRIDAPPGVLTPITRAATADVRVGDVAYAIACPYGLGPSLSTGVVSGLGRRIRAPTGVVLDSVVQTDAALHPGSSGGALVDGAGRVIGMNAAVQEDVGSKLGVGFAQPIDHLVAVVPSIIEHGYAWFPELGFTVLGDEAAAVLFQRLASGARPGAPIPTAGAIVTDVEQSGRAAAAGVRPWDIAGTIDVLEEITVKDVIVAVGDVRVSDKRDLARALAALEPGAPISFFVARPQGEVRVELRP